MKPFYLLFFILVFASKCFSQGFPAFTSDASIVNPPLPFVFDGKGKPLYWGASYIADGSPYFHDEYINADITSTTGIVYKNVKVKFNLSENQLQYLGQDSTEMVSETPVRSIEFFVMTADSLKKTKLISNTGILNSKDAIIFEVIDSGKISLLKKITINYRDETKYGSTNTTRTFIRKENEFYLLIDADYKKIIKTKSFFSQTLNDKKNEIDTFITKNNIKCKSPDDFSAIVQFYNSSF